MRHVLKYVERNGIVMSTCVQDKVGALGSALQRVESERNELRKKYLSVGDKVDHSEFIF